MKKLLLLSIIISNSTFGNFIISAQGFGSQPLFKFNQSNYSSGVGLELGWGYEFKLIDSLMFEINGHFQFGENGDKNIILPIGRYSISNDFTSSHLEIKIRKNYGSFEPYIGLHVGIGRYHTDELLVNKSSNPEESFTYRDMLFSRKIFQYGASVGAYIKIRPNLYFDFGASINAGGESVNFIALPSIMDEKGVLDYNVNESIPTVLLFNFGIVVSIAPFSWSDYSSTSQYENDYEDIYYGDERPVCKPKKPLKKNNDHSKGHHNDQKKDRKLIKKGKTPIGF